MPTKKATTKAPTKKKVAKKATTKAVKKVAKKTKSKSGKKDLVYSNNQTAFWVSDGQILNSLVALRDALSDMEKEVYQYHANGWQNDFAQWVEVVLGDADCAKDLKKSRTPKTAKTVVVRHLKYYTL